MRERAEDRADIQAAPELSRGALLIAAIATLCGVAGFAAFARIHFGAQGGAVDRPVAIPSPGVDESEVEEMLEKVERLIRSGSATSALALAEKLKRRNPEQPWAHLLLGHARFMAGRRRGAMESYEKALSIRPELMSNLRMIEHVEEGLVWDDIGSEAAAMLARMFGRNGVDILERHANSETADAEERRFAREALVEAGYGDKVDWSLCRGAADPQEMGDCEDPRSGGSTSGTAGEVER